MTKKLESMKSPLPRFPTQEEMAQSKKERQEEAQEELRNNPPIPYADRCKEAFLEKDKGNELFAKGDYEAARKAYDGGMIHVYIHKDEWNCVLKKEERRMILDVKVSATVHILSFSTKFWLIFLRSTLALTSPVIDFVSGRPCCTSTDVPVVSSWSSGKMRFGTPTDPLNTTLIIPRLTIGDY